ncbi:hypothetical protein RSSM_05802 [Rhodopirellula sallentina SM41]|uniref:Uncharacterized protein n=1 Tax=Rhodopirellula sallentina SM41 TaxID=1263870 RepID=M5U4E1_9BACT|nr:hypothetical protein RSSM_05802 [Rhodopirellula sallentina SM41]
MNVVCAFPLRLVFAVDESSSSDIFRAQIEHPDVSIGSPTLAVGL